VSNLEEVSMSRGTALFVHAVAALLVAVSVGGAQEIGQEDPGFHGMLVLGGETVYISHLPMFNAPHRYQGIWEVSFGAEGDREYRTERARPANAKQIFTLAPTEEFRLPELTTTKRSFRGNVFVGHFERDDKRLLLTDVTVTLKKLVHFHPFNRGHRLPEGLTYLLFGTGNERFLAHWVSVAPNFDQVLVVSPNVSIGEIPPGALFTVPGRRDSERLRTGDLVSGVVVAARGPEQPFLVKPIELRLASEYYFEAGELAPDKLPQP
jgi:hypothetical protein